jgi:hypothetical protein
LFWPEPSEGAQGLPTVAPPPVIVVAPPPAEPQPIRQTASARNRESKDRDAGAHGTSYRAGGPLDDRR